MRNLSCLDVQRNIETKKNPVFTAKTGTSQATIIPKSCFKQKKSDKLKLKKSNSFKS